MSFPSISETFASLKNLLKGRALSDVSFRDHLAAARNRLRSRKASGILGLDVGTAHVRGAYTARHGEFSASQIQTAACAVGSASDPAGRDAETASALKIVLSALPEAGRIHAVVNDPRLFLAAMTFPRMPLREIREAVPWEIRGQISFPPEEAIIDVQVLGEIVEGDARKLRILVGALPLEAAERWARIFVKAGIRPRTMTTSCVALQAWLSRSPLGREDGLAVLDLGAGFSELAIYERSALRFVRRLPVAGNDLTRSLTEVLATPQGRIQLSWPEAEEVKTTAGISPGGPPETPRLTHTQILSLMGPHLERLARELRRSFETYAAEMKEDHVRRLVLIGAGARLPGLPEFLQAETEVRVGLADEPAAGEGNRGAASSQAVAACLLPGRALNLAPPLLPTGARRWLERVSLQTVTAAAVTTWLVLFTGLRMRISNYEKRLSVHATELATLKVQLSRARSQQNLASLGQSRELWERIFKTLSAGTPAEAYLTSFEMTENAVRIAGTFFARGATPDMTRFLLALEESGFRNARLSSFGPLEAGRGSFSFEVTCEL